MQKVVGSSTIIRSLGLPGRSTSGLDAGSNSRPPRLSPAFGSTYPFRMPLSTHMWPRKATRSEAVMRPDHARVVALLESAEGRWLSYEDLEAHGVPSPGLVGYELAAAGWAISPAVVTGPN